MKLRSKFFSVLVIFSLLPLAPVVWVGGREMARLGDEIAEDVHRQISGLWRQILRLTTEDSAAIVQANKRAFEFALSLLVREAEAVFAEEPPGRVAVLLASDFDDPFRTPPEAQWRPGGAGGAAQGSGGGYWISHRRPALLLAPGLSEEEAREDIDRLTALEDVLREIAGRLGTAFHAAFAVTETGVQIVFPGRGGFPGGYDPRLRPGFAEAAGEPRWIGPVVDPGSRRSLLSVVQRVSYPDGTPAAAVGLEVLLSEVLRVEALSSIWRSESVSSYLVEAVPAPAGRGHELLVFARRDQEAEELVWNGLSVPEPFAETEPEAAGRLAQAVFERRSGVVEMDCRGGPCLWAYAPMHGEVAFLVAVPQEVISRLPERAIAAIAAFSREEIRVVSLAVAGALLVAVLAAWIGSRRFARPMAALAEAAAEISRGRFDLRLGLRTGDERDRLIEAFNAMGPKLEEHLRMRSGLLLASEVQQRLLPRRMPSWPGLEVAGASLSCDETGGDYYDLFEDAGGTPCIAVGDVSGHGIPAALLMATARATLRMRAVVPGGCAEIIADVNRRLAEDFGESGAFMTMFFLCLDGERRRLRWVRAGHPPALLYDPLSGRFRELRGSGLPLGVDPQARFVEEGTGPLNAGSVVFIGTDGIWETLGPGGGFFGQARLRDIISHHGKAPARVLVQAVVQELERFRCGLRAPDDVTLVALRVL